MRLRIEKPVYGGAGLARADGKAIFVEGALPGELVEARLRRDKGSFAEAELVEVVEPAPDRVAAPCPYYGACGGCQYQHAAYPAQLAMKQAVLEEALGRAGLRDLPPVEAHAAEPWGYRNRVRLHVEAGTGRVGYRRRGSHDILPVELCPIASPALEEGIAALSRLASLPGAGKWCAEIELFAGEEGAGLQASFFARSSYEERGAWQLFMDRLRPLLPRLTGASLLAPKPARPGRTEGRQEPDNEREPGRVLASWGRSSLTYKVGANEYQVSPGAFFQANRFLIGKLVDLATEGAAGRLAWDLYAGVGLFSRVLARRFERVIAVEGAPVSCADLCVNVPQARVVVGDVLAFLRRPPRERPDLVVLDPPRAGLGKDASRLLSQIGTPDITYVSCDPATLARDLRIFADSGYALQELHLVDMFPQTFHMEAVAKLRRR